jgi:UrcA family protein
MNRHIRTTGLLTFAALMLASVPLTAGFAETRSVRVHSFDLDLASPAGQAEMQRRIHHAIDQVCGPAGGVTMDDRMSDLSCNRNAQASAMSQFEHMVAAARQGKMASNGDVVIVR